MNCFELETLPQTQEQQMQNRITIRATAWVTMEVDEAKLRDNSEVFHVEIVKALKQYVEQG